MATASQKTAFILGSANWDMIAAQVRKKCTDIVPFDLDISARPFGQYLTEIYTPDSDLFAAQPDYLILAERFEDILLPLQDPRLIDDAAKARFDQYLAAIRHLSAHSGSVLIVHEMTLTRPIGSDRAAHQVWAMLSEMNQALRDLVEKLPDCHFLGLGQLVAKIGQQGLEPGKYWLLGRLPFGMGFSTPYAGLLCGLLLSLNGKTARVLVLDLDNTLWGGVVGDDGVTGIKLGPDFPGNQFVQFQSFLRSMLDKGVILTICSKNFEDAALEAIRSHPDMVLRPEDFVAWRINWEPKSQNILALSQSLGLGLDSFLFIDDNPVEREDVRTACAGVTVPEMPLDVTEWPGFLADLPQLFHHSQTDADTNKTRQYAVRAKVEELREAAPDRETFLKGLGMSVDMQQMDPQSRARILQLIHKTNQFNTTTIRYAEHDLDAILADGGAVFSVRIRDRFGSDEINLVMVVERTDTTATIAAFVMSCRVMGRGVEAAALALVSEWAMQNGCTMLAGLVRESDRNDPARDVFTRHGFAPTGDGSFHYNLEQGSIERPSWFHYASASDKKTKAGEIRQ